MYEENITTLKQYSKGSHTIHIHHYHIVWITKYRYKVLQGKLQQRIREIIIQVASEMNIRIINGAVSSDHVHIFVEIAPHIKVSEFVQKAKGKSSRKVQLEFPELKRTYWGKHFWARGYFSATSGNVTDQIINEYINSHTDAHQVNSQGNITLTK